jgi:hypothetical protein
VEAIAAASLTPPSRAGLRPARAPTPARRFARAEFQGPREAVMFGEAPYDAEQRDELPQRRR